MKHREQAFEHARHIVPDIGIRHTHNPIPHVLQVGSAHSIIRNLSICPVRRAIDLEDQLLLSAYEVDIIVADRCLSHELEPTQLAIAKS